jgi:hypothetical protein
MPKRKKKDLTFFTKIYSKWNINLNAKGKTEPSDSGSHP